MAHRRRFSLAVAIATNTLLVGGCAVGPDFERPAAPDVTGYTSAPFEEQTASSDVAGGGAQRFVQGLDIPGQWWTLFHSSALNTLIEEALKNNPTLPAAEAALRLAWENVYAAQGAFFPTAVVSYSPSRNKTATGVVFTAASSGPPFFTLHTAQVVVSYAPDVFGGKRRAIESAKAQEDYQRFALEASYLTLTANVVTAIEPTMQRAEIERLKHKAAANLTAYDHLLRAQQLEYEFTEQSLDAALRQLRDALDADPCYAPAMAFAARCAPLGTGRVVEDVSARWDVWGIPRGVR